VVNHFPSARFTYETSAHSSETREAFDTVQLHFSGTIGTAGLPDMQKIRIIGVFFENGLHWQVEA